VLCEISTKQYQFWGCVPRCNKCLWNRRKITNSLVKERDFNPHRPSTRRPWAMSSTCACSRVSCCVKSQTNRFFTRTVTLQSLSFVLSLHARQQRSSALFVKCTQSSLESISTDSLCLKSCCILVWSEEKYIFVDALRRLHTFCWLQNNYHLPLNVFVFAKK